MFRVSPLHLPFSPLLLLFYVLSSAGVTSMVLTRGIFLAGTGKPRSKNSDLFDPMFFHSSANVGGSFILLGWIESGLGGSWPGYRFPLNPWNSGNLLRAVMRMIVLNMSLKPIHKKAKLPSYIMERLYT